jgi:hypothetical protein
MTSCMQDSDRAKFQTNKLPDQILLVRSIIFLEEFYQYQPIPDYQSTRCPGPMSHRCPSHRREFLTHEITCTDEMIKKTTSKIIYQKGPPLSGSTPGQATCGTCCLDQRQQALAASGISGKLPSQRRRLPPSSQVGPAAWVTAGMLAWQVHGPCRLEGRRHLRRCWPTNGADSHTNWKRCAG